MTKKKVLIVEDNKLNFKLFKDLLELNDIEVLYSENEIDIFDYAKENEPDLILMDIQLRTVSGIDLIMKFKEKDHTKHIPIIAVTACAMKSDQEKILRSGCEEYMPKPISIDHFISVVKKYLYKN